MPDDRDVESMITRLFLERLQIAVPAPDVDLFATGVVDSLMFVKLLAALEEQFAIHVSFEELEIDDFRTVRQIAGFVAAKRTGDGGLSSAPRRVGASGSHPAP